MQGAGQTYMGSGLELGRIDGILVETFPLLKSLFGILVVLFVVPVQHAGRILDTNTLAELLKNSRGGVQKVIGIDNANVHGSALVLSVCCVLTSDLGANLTARTKVVEQTALLVVSSLGGHEVVETSDLIKRRNGASPVAGNAVLGVTNEEGEVEFVENFGRNHSRVSGLSLGGIGIRRRLVNMTIGVLNSLARSRADVRQGVAAVGLGTDTALDLEKRRSN